MHACCAGEHPFQEFAVAACRAELRQAVLSAPAGLGSPGHISVDYLTNLLGV